MAPLTGLGALKLPEARLKNDVETAMKAVRLSLRWEQPEVFLQGVAIGHPGQVVANRAGPAFAPRALAGLGSDFLVVGQVIVEQVLQHPAGPDMRLVHRRVIIKV